MSATDATPELIARFAAGDRDSYDVLFRRYRRPLRGFLRRHADPAFSRLVSVDDLEQEVHLEAIRQLGAGRFTYRRELSFFLWLCGIGRYRILGHYRRLHREPPVARYARPAGQSSSRDLLGALRSPTRSPVEELSLREHLELLALAFSRLPERRREALVLRYLEGRRGPEAAEQMGLKPGTFRVLVSRALVSLRDALAELLGEYDTPPGRRRR